MSPKSLETSFHKLSDRLHGTFHEGVKGRNKTMSIRMLAQELYRLERDVESLEKRLETAPPEERTEAENHLRSLRAERDRLRSILAAKKEPPPYRQPK